VVARITTTRKDSRHVRAGQEEIDAIANVIRQRAFRYGVGGE